MDTIPDFFTVRFYSDSLGLQRDKDVFLTQRYIYLLKEYWESKKKHIDIQDRARGNSNINDLLKWSIEDKKYFGEKCDVVILQEGIVDCAPRPIPRKVRNIISKMPQIVRNKIISFLHKNRSKMQKLGLKYYYIKPDDYYEKYKIFVTNASLNANRVYLINIAPTNSKTEMQSPGLSNAINQYNQIIEKIVKDLNANNVFLIDVFSLIKNREFEIDNYINKEDGHHITIMAHKLYAEKIIEQEERITTTISDLLL